MSGFIYNVTTKVNHSVHNNWLIWIKNEHIPAMIATSCFTQAVLLKLKGVDNSEGFTYAVQYYANAEQDYDRYLEQYAVNTRQSVLDKWGDKIISFRTTLEIVD